MDTVYPFFSRSPYFRGFHGWPSFRENKMTAKSANWSKLREARRLTRPYGLHVHYARVVIMYVIGSLLYEYSISSKCKNMCDYYTKRYCPGKFLQKQYLRLYLKSVKIKIHELWKSLKRENQVTAKKNGYTVYQGLHKIKYTQNSIHVVLLLTAIKQCSVREC